MLLNWNILTGACQVLILDMFPWNRLVSIKLFFGENLFFLSAVGVTENSDLFALFFQLKIKEKPGVAITMVKCLHLCCNKVNDWGQILLYARTELHLPGLVALLLLWGAAKCDSRVGIWRCLFCWWYQNVELLKICWFGEVWAPCWSKDGLKH